MIDEVIPIDTTKMKTINDLHKAMCDTVKVGFRFKKTINFEIIPFKLFKPFNLFYLIIKSDHEKIKNKLKSI